MGISKPSQGCVKHQKDMDVLYFLWHYPTVPYYPCKHPCEKPAAMLEHIINASSRPGDVVLDCFMGSGSTGKACKALGRHFIGIELDDGIFNQVRAAME